MDSLPHCPHAAQLCALVPSVPDVVGAIVMKLLAKATDERRSASRSRSEPGRGPTFEIYLPRSAKAATRARPPSAPPPPAKGETVLLVEDHVNLRKLVADGLESTGYRVLAAASGSEAIAIASAHAGSIELLITDLVMPKMDGLELAAKLESDRPQMKVLCVSGCTEASLGGDRRPGPRMQFLSEPFTPDELAKRTRVILDGE